MQNKTFEKKNICGQMCLYTQNLYSAEHCIVIFTGNPSIVGFYEDFAEYVTYEEFVAFNGAYLKVSVGKGLTTFDKIIEMINRYLR